MSEHTKIEWADHSWSPWRGCTQVSPGCANCYAETLSRRNPAVLGEWGRGRPRVLAKNWNDPLRWQARTAMDMPSPRVFPSLCDWLDEEVPLEWFARFLDLIHQTPSLTWLLLTKRPDSWGRRVEAVVRWCDANDCKDPATGCSNLPVRNMLADWLALSQPPPNVWFGISVEDQIRADERIPWLMKIPARLRWLSLEPLLGPVDLRFEDVSDGMIVRRFPSIDWLVIGGESGSGARRCSVEWIRGLMSQGRASGVPVFVKQLGARPRTRTATDLPEWSSGRSFVKAHEGAYLHTIHHPKGGDPMEWPEDLRVREYPGGSAP